MVGASSSLLMRYMLFHAKGLRIFFVCLSISLFLSEKDCELVKQDRWSIFKERWIKPEFMPITKMRQYFLFVYQLISFFFKEIINFINKIDGAMTELGEFMPTKTMQVAITEQGEEGKHSCTCTHSDGLQVASDDKLTVTMREEAPTHYTLEIESFQFFLNILSKTKPDRYESTEFEVSGYKWRLILYPERDKERDGYGHISLYLENLSIQNMGRGRAIDALLNFFVYNYNKNKYTSIQDGRVKRFDAVNRECGFSRLLPLTEFNTSKGYLSPHKSCKFGVEVFVIKSEGKGECFSTIDNTNKDQFISWKVNFPKLLNWEESRYSDEQLICDYNWKLHLYPEGVKKGVEYVSIFLCLQDKPKFPAGSKMHVEFKLRISYHLPDFNYKQIERTGNAWFSGYETAWGFPYFTKLSNLQNATGRRVNDVLVEAEISSISMIKDIFPDMKEKPKDTEKV